jgi:hypothetical protein
MASLAEIRTAIQATLDAAFIDDPITGYDQVPESVNVPAFVVVPRASDFQLAFGRGIDSYTFGVIVLVSRRDDELAQEDLDPYVTGAGASSIRQAIWGARHLGLGDDVEARVTGMTDYGGTYAFGSTEYAGAQLTVEVLTSGTA